MSQIRKIVLAYSGGLDTSVMLKWLQDHYKAEVITFTADLGQGEEIESARAKAEAANVKHIHIEDLKERFARDFIYPMLHANAQYEGEYLLGTAIARPLIAQRLVEIAQEHGADAIAHGATGKGNDQVRFELGAYALSPNIQVIAPWRSWPLKSRQDLLDYCEKHQIQVDFQQQTKTDDVDDSPYSMDANLWHISYEGGKLEDPEVAPDENMWRLTKAPEAASDKPEEIKLSFIGGNCVAINDENLSAAQVIIRLNEIGGAHAIGRLDLVENRRVGMKSRGCYETPGGTLLLKAHRAIESITLDPEVAHLKDDLMPRYAKLIYDGYWWSPERRMLQALLTVSQEVVNGWVKLKLFKGSLQVMGRGAAEADSLYDADMVTFEEDTGNYRQEDASGFITINALRLKLGAGKGRKLTN